MKREKLICSSHLNIDPRIFISFPYFSGKIDSRSLVPWGNSNAHKCQRHWHQPTNWYRFNVQVWMKMLLSTSDVHSNIMIFCVWSHCFWSVSGITFYNINPLSGFISLMLNITPCKAVVWPFSLLEQSWRTTDCKFWNDLCSKLIQSKLSNNLDGIEIGNEESPLHWKGRGYTPENVACWNRTGEGVRSWKLKLVYHGTCTGFSWDLPKNKSWKATYGVL